MKRVEVRIPAALKRNWSAAAARNQRVWRESTRRKGRRTGTRGARLRLALRDWPLAGITPVSSS